MVEPLWRTVWQFYNADSLHDLAIPLLGIQPRELKTYPHATTLT